MDYQSIKVHYGGRFAWSSDWAARYTSHCRSEFNSGDYPECLTDTCRVRVQFWFLGRLRLLEWAIKRSSAFWVVVMIANLDSGVVAIMDRYLLSVLALHHKPAAWWLSKMDGQAVARLSSKHCRVCESRKPPVKYGIGSRTDFATIEDLSEGLFFRTLETALPSMSLSLLSSRKSHRVICWC